MSTASARALAHLRRTLDVRAGEGLPILFLLSFSLCAGVFMALFFTAANAAFLGRFEIAALPTAYMVSAVVGGLVTGGLSLLGRRARFASLVVGSLVGVFALVCLAWGGLRFVDAPWVSFLLFVWIDPLFTIVDLGFWGLAGRLFDLQQAKRLFGLVSSGEVVSAIVGFVLVPALLRLGAVPLLMLVAAVGVAGCALIALATVRRFPAALASAPVLQSASSAGGGVAGGGRYVGLVCAAVVLVVVMLYFVDFSLLTSVKLKYSSAEAVGGFLALYWAATRGVELVTKTLVSGRLIGHFGLLFGLLSLPAAVLLLALLTGLGGAAAGTAGALFFVLVAVTRLVEFVVRRSLFDPSFKVLFQPLDERVRFAVQTRVDGVVRQLGLLVAGAALFLLARLPAVGVGGVMALAAAVAVACAAILVLVFREYRGKLREALSRRTGGVLREAPADLIRRTLGGVDPVVALYGFDLLLRVDPGLTEQLLGERLDAADAGERLEGIACVQRYLMVTLRPRVEALAGDPDPEVRRQATAASGALRRVEAMSSSPERIAELAGSTERRDRLQAALALARRGAVAPRRLLLELLWDGDDQVRRVALVAAGRTGSSEYWPRILESLPSGLFCQSAMAGLLASGEAVLPALDFAFTRFATQPTTLLRILKICERIGGEEASRLLFGRIDHPHRDVQLQALLSLSSRAYQARAFQVPLVRGMIEVVVGRIAWIAAASRDLGTRREVAAVVESLTAQLGQERDSVFFLLGLICEPDAVRMLRESFGAGGGGDVYALEIAAEVAPAELHPILFPVLEGLAAEPLVERLALYYPQKTLGAGDRLEDIISQGYDRVDPWTRSCAVAALAEIGVAGIPDALIANLFHPHRMVREMVAAAMLQLDPAGYQRHLSRLPEEGARELDAVARQRDRRRLRVFERVQALRRTAIFTPLPSPIVARLAADLTETRLAAGALIFSQGEAGRSMYVVAEGRVRISQDGAIINYVGQGEVLGEIAALATEVRSASARAETAIRLLEIDQDRILSLLADHLEVLPDLLAVVVERLANEPAAA